MLNCLVNFIELSANFWGGTNPLVGETHTAGLYADNPLIQLFLFRRTSLLGALRY